MSCTDALIVQTSDVTTTGVNGAIALEPMVLGSSLRQLYTHDTLMPFIYNA